MKQREEEDSDWDQHYLHDPNERARGAEILRSFLVETIFAWRVFRGRERKR